MREFIDKAMMLREYRDILDYDINHPKYENTVREIIEEANEITEQKIVKPYLEKIIDEINHLNSSGGFANYNSYCHMFDFVDELLPEQENNNEID